ncbi:MAG: TIGR04551 family protein [Deltaproteobacteria bacterium]|nr:TIGR04551 family protein [Deltaproteobacteria bacterium]
MKRTLSLAWVVLGLWGGSARAQEPGTEPAVPAQPSEPAAAPAVENTAPTPAPVTPAAPASPAPATLTPEELDRLRNEIKSDLREEMRVEIEKAAREAAQTRRQAAEWEEESWVEELKPKLNFLDFDGYFRTRVDLFQRAHLGTYDPAVGVGTSNVPPPLNYPTPDDRHDTLTSANMRLRLDPTLNVSEDIRLRMTADILDNVVLGSTPDTLPGLAINPGNPLSAFTTSQLPPEMGVNTFLGSSIRLKRAWGEVTTPFGQVRFGRMASHFGLGILANDGNCLECDSGSSSDRIMFVTRVLGHYIIPMWEFTASGPVGRGGGPAANTLMFHPNEQGQPFDLDPRDDVKSWILAVAKRDSPADIREKLNGGGFVLNYGAYGQFRQQSYDTPLYYLNGPGRGIQAGDMMTRNAWATIGSLWGLFQWRKLKIEGELAGIYGHIGNMQTSGTLPNGMVANYKLVNGTPVYLDAEGKGFGVPHCYAIPRPESFLRRGAARPGEDGFSPSNLRFPPDPSQGWLDLGPGACIQQLGFALEASYSFLNDSLIIGGGLGYASGDDAPGFGVRNGANNFMPTRRGDLDGRQFGAQTGQAEGGGACTQDETNTQSGPCVTDNTIQNFKFNPDYRVDMLMFREVIGTVTDAVYVKPSVTYYILDGLGVRGDAIAAIAQYSSSTPGDSNLLGAEFNGHLFYKSEDGFYAGFTYAFMLPLAGFHHARCDKPSTDLNYCYQKDAYSYVSPDNQNKFGEAKFAQRFHGILGIQF